MATTDHTKTANWIDLPDCQFSSKTFGTFRMNHIARKDTRPFALDKIRSNIIPKIGDQTVSLKYRLTLGIIATAIVRGTDGHIFIVNDVWGVVFIPTGEIEPLNNTKEVRSFCSTHGIMFQEMINGEKAFVKNGIVFKFVEGNKQVAYGYFVDGAFTPFKDRSDYIGFMENTLNNNIYFMIPDTVPFITKSGFLFKIDEGKLIAYAAMKDSGRCLVPFNFTKKDIEICKDNHIAYTLTHPGFECDFVTYYFTCNVSYRLSEIEGSGGEESDEEEESTETIIKTHFYSVVDTFADTVRADWKEFFTRHVTNEFRIGDEGECYRSYDRHVEIIGASYSVNNGDLKPLIEKFVALSSV